MAYNEQKASLPPIIEDESDDNLMPMLYKKELGRCGSRAENKSVRHDEGRSSPSNNSTNGTQMPYNSWKSKNAAYLTSPEIGRDSSDMQSKLGQSLQTSPMFVSPHLKQTPALSNQFYQQGGESANYRNMSPQFQNRSGAGLSSHVEGEERYLHQVHETFDPKSFDSPCSTGAKGYFPGRSTSYRAQPPLYNSHMTNFSPDFPSHDSFKFPQAESRMFNHSNVSSSPYGLPNVSPSAYKLQQMSPNPYQPPMFQNDPRGLPCQNSCCSSAQAHNSSMSRFKPDKTHTPQGNPGYQEPRRHNIDSSQKTPCQCHETTNSKSKKPDGKLEKGAKKQITDLYRIVWLQNQQIMELQNQVKKLIELHERFDEKSRKPDQDHAPKILSKNTSEKRMFNLSVIEENQNLMEKVSVGIMTSFIDNTTVKTKGKSKKSKSKSRRTQESSESSSSSTETSSDSSSEEEEIPESTKKNKHKKKRGTKAIEDSIILNGLDIQTVAENPPSPTSTSMHIDLQDFAESSASDESNSSESDEDEENENQVPVSWTFYDKVVGKVNNILNKSESDDETSIEVRNKTLEQLRKLGINFVEQDSSPISKRVTFDSPYNQKVLAESDTSMRMNALAVKYLKEEKPTHETGDSVKAIGTGVGNNNLSQATMRYLERYHLTPRITPQTAEKPVKTKKKKEKKREEKNTPKRRSKSGQMSGKILDITAIKQQPKLLPKKM